jgi:hypothetical protein
MAQIFHRSTNTISRLSIYGAVFVLAGLAWTGAEIQRSPYVTTQGVVKDQPVPFSHQHHVAGLGIDCRYCHTSVETSAFAGLPPTKTCMNCHSQIWNDSPMLEPVRASFRNNQPLVWTRVHDLPDFVYFNHSIHVAKGVGCATCHGRVDQMPLMYQAQSLQMEWCLECHRAPEKFLRPESEIFNMKYQPPTPESPVTIQGEAFTSQEALGRYLVKQNHLRRVEGLTSCSTCHR